MRKLHRTLKGEGEEMKMSYMGKLSIFFGITWDFAGLDRYIIG